MRAQICQYLQRNVCQGASGWYDKSIHGDEFLFKVKAQEITILRDIVEKVHSVHQWRIQGSGPPPPPPFRPNFF